MPTSQLAIPVAVGVLLNWNGISGTIATARIFLKVDISLTLNFFFGCAIKHGVTLGISMAIAVLIFRNFHGILL
jgi:hypothetical protein